MEQQEPTLDWFDKYPRTNESPFPRSQMSAPIDMSTPDVRQDSTRRAGRRASGGNRRLVAVLTADFLTSLGANLLTVGIFFYTSHRFGWTLKQNFLLAVGQGSIYIVMALLASPISNRLGRRVTLTTFFLLMAASAAAAVFVNSPGVIAGLLLAYVGMSAVCWPVLESLVCTGRDAAQLSRRVGQYNLVWSGASPLIIAVSGTVVVRFPVGVFLLPVVFQIAGALLVAFRNDLENPTHAVGTAAAASVPPHPALLRKRTEALWLSRIALPSTYVVVYSLMAMMPSLPVMQRLGMAEQTVLGSVWLVARWVAFLLLGATVWWHTRPRVMLLAAAAMLVAFVGTTIAPSTLLGPGAKGADIASMVGWQIALGLSMGLIYTASLYFGMVLSESSTKHGGYHEALIGLGSVLGPGVGVAAQTLYPGNVNAGIVAVAGVVTLSVIAAGIASWRFGAPMKASPNSPPGLPDPPVSH